MSDAEVFLHHCLYLLLSCYSLVLHPLTCIASVLSVNIHLCLVQSLYVTQSGRSVEEVLKKTHNPEYGHPANSLLYKNQIVVIKGFIPTLVQR